MPRSVEDLIASVATGADPSGIDELLPRYLPRLEAYLRLRAGKLVLARESVSDLAQSVCRDVLENLDRYQFRGEDNFRRWLYTTAARKLGDRRAHWNAQKRDVKAEAIVGQSEVNSGGFAEFASMLTPSRDAIAHEEIAAVERALAELPEDQREAILLTRVLGLRRAEAAEVLGKSEGSVRMLICRGLAVIATAVGGSA